MSTIIYLDVETSGLNPTIHGILQIACIAEVNGVLVGSFNEYLKPHDSLKIDKKALEVNGIKKKQIKLFEDEKIVLDKLVKWVAKYGSYLQPCGYNVGFDTNFLKELYARHDVSYPKSFNYYDIDTFSIVKVLVAEDKLKKGENLKLGTVCKQMGIKLDNAHDALADIKATRELHKKLVKEFLK